MKRKRGTKEEAVARPSSMSSKAALTLSNLADDLVASVLSFIDFYERPIIRRVCRRLLQSVDSVKTPENLTLLIVLVQTSTQERQRMGRRSWIVSVDSDNALVTVRVKQSLGMENFPLMCGVRPTALHVKSEANDGHFDARLLKHLAKDVGETVTKLSTWSLQALSPLELQESVAEFDRKGDLVTDLCLHSTKHSLHDITSAIIRLHGLTHLDLTVQDTMIPRSEQADSVGQEISRLASLPNLENLVVRGLGTEMKSVSANFLHSCASLSNLKVLSADCLDLDVDIPLGTWNAHTNDGGRTGYFTRGTPFTAHCVSFATMLQRLPNLKEIGILFYPGEHVWKEVSEKGGHHGLEKVAVNYFEPGPNCMDELVPALIEHFPSLIELELHLGWMRYMPDADLMNVLKGLKSHPSLTTIKCGWFDSFSEDFCQKLREVVGERITVIEIPHKHKWIPYV